MSRLDEVIWNPGVADGSGRARVRRVPRAGSVACSVTVMGWVLAATAGVAWAQQTPRTPPGSMPQPDPLAEPSPPPVPEVLPPTSPLREVDPEGMDPERPEESPAPVTPASPEAPASAPPDFPPPPRVRLQADGDTEEADCDCRDEHEAAEGGGSFLLGAGYFDLSSLNDRLQANGYESINEVPTILGGEGRAIFDSGFVVGIRGAGFFFPDAGGPDDVQADLGGGFGMLDLGVAFVRQDHLAVTLTAGVGGYGLTLALSDRASDSFDDVLQDPARSATLSRGGLLTGLTLGCDGRVPFGPVKRGRRGFFTIGARLSALYGPSLGGWDLAEGGEATGGPDDALIGGFAAVSIGFGGMQEP